MTEQTLLPFSPYTEIATLVFLAAVVALVVGWFAARKRIDMRVFDEESM
ncbi:hypothetical protein AB0C38_47265 [Amycolatopsis sp. NPDC048633]